jgi:hypothetical protein
MIRLKMLLFSLTFTVISCKKADVSPPPIPISAYGEEYQKGANDETVRLEYNRLLDLVSVAYELDYIKSKKIDTTITTFPCGISSVDSNGSGLDLVFAGECNSRILTGKASIESLNTIDWNQRSATIKINIQDYIIKFTSNNKEITLNGQFTLASSNGGLISEIIPNSGGLAHEIRGNIDITFDNDSTRTWRITQKRYYRSAGSRWEDIQLRIDGDSGYSIAETGKNKMGYDFVSNYNTPLVFYSCNSNQNWIPEFTLATGQYSYNVGTTSVNVQAGYSGEENGYTLVENCNSKRLKIDWYFNNGSKVEYLEY